MALHWIISLSIIDFIEINLDAIGTRLVRSLMVNVGAISTAKRKLAVSLLSRPRVASVVVHSNLGNMLSSLRLVYSIAVILSAVVLFFCIGCVGVSVGFVTFPVYVVDALGILLVAEGSLVEQEQI
jgi:hypothetical protein